MFFLCIGTNPSKVTTHQRKVNFHIQGTAMFGIVSFICLWVRVKIFSKISSVKPLLKPKGGLTLPPIKDILENNTMSSMGTISLMALSILPSWSMHFVMNILTAEVLSDDPYQIIIHFHHHGHKWVVFNLLTVLLFLSRSAIRRAVLRELYDKSQQLVDFIGLK